MLVIGHALMIMNGIASAETSIFNMNMSIVHCSMVLTMPADDKKPMRKDMKEVGNTHTHTQSTESESGTNKTFILSIAHRT